jgi:hypothetical protein
MAATPAKEVAFSWASPNVGEVVFGDPPSDHTLVEAGSNPMEGGHHTG